jgi:hypothetical protein
MLPEKYLPEKWESVERALQLLEEIDLDEASLLFPLPPVVQKHTASRKRPLVRFAPVISTSVSTLSRDDLTEQEKTKIWWTVQECAEFRHRAKQVASYTRQEGRSFTRKTLEIPFEVALATADAYREECLGGVLRDPSPFVGDLTEWSRLSNARRGLEHRVVTSSLRASTAAKQRKRVLSSLSMGSSALAEIAQASSRPSRVFARMIGFGDAIVAEGTPENITWTQATNQ